MGNCRDLAGQSCCAPTSNGQPTAMSVPPTTPGLCPQCGSQGKQVGGATLTTMLAISLQSIRDVPYWFCREANCSVVYFSADGQQTFTTEQVRERVHQKEPTDEDVFVCYCFRHTPGSIAEELQATGTSAVVEEINAGIQAGKCACEWRNPQGSCCLGNVRAAVKRLSEDEELVQADQPL